MTACDHPLDGHTHGPWCEPGSEPCPPVTSNGVSLIVAERRRQVEAEGKPITCPACGGSGELPTENEGDRPAVICDMCGGAGWGILDPGPPPKENT